MSAASFLAVSGVELTLPWPDDFTKQMALQPPCFLLDGAPSPDIDIEGLPRLPEARSPGPLLFRQLKKEEGSATVGIGGGGGGGGGGPGSFNAVGRPASAELMYTPTPTLTPVVTVARRPAAIQPQQLDAEYEAQLELCRRRQAIANGNEGRMSPYPGDCGPLSPETIGGGSSVDEMEVADAGEDHNHEHGYGHGGSSFSSPSEPLDPAPSFAAATARAAAAAAASPTFISYPPRLAGGGGTTAITTTTAKNYSGLPNGSGSATSTTTTRVNSPPTAAAAPGSFTTSPNHPHAHALQATDQSYHPSLATGNGPSPSSSSPSSSPLLSPSHGGIAAALSEAKAREAKATTEAAAAQSKVKSSAKALSEARCAEADATRNSFKAAGRAAVAAEEAKAAALVVSAGSTGRIYLAGAPRTGPNKKNKKRRRSCTVVDSSSAAAAAATVAALGATVAGSSSDSAGKENRGGQSGISPLADGSINSNSVLLLPNGITNSSVTAGTAAAVGTAVAVGTVHRKSQHGGERKTLAASRGEGPGGAKSSSNPAGGFSEGEGISTAAGVHSGGLVAGVMSADVLESIRTKPLMGWGAEVEAELGTWEVGMYIYTSCIWSNRLLKSQCSYFLTKAVGPSRVTLRYVFPVRGVRTMSIEPTNPSENTLVYDLP